MNLECCVVASSGQLDVVADLPRLEVFESPYDHTLGDVRLREDQTLIVSTQALVDPLDDEIDSSCKNDLCSSSASPYNLNKVLLPIDKSTHTLVDPCANQGESTLVCELPTTSKDMNEDQLIHECIPLLEHICGVLKKSQVSDGVYRVDLDGARDSLNMLCGKILASSFVHRDHVYANVVNYGICLFEVGLLGRASLFLNVSLLLKENVIRSCGSDILGEGRANLGLDPWLLLPFDPGTLRECGNFYTFYLMLGQDDKQCLIVGANKGRQGSSLSLFVDDDLFFCAIYTKEVVNGSEMTQLEAEDAHGTLQRWKIKVGKAMFALKTTTEEDVLEHIRDATTQKQAWDIFAKIFSKKNDTRIQLLESELLSIGQHNMTIAQYIHKVMIQE
ncbi:hypothetical protein CQW23_14877 [Capsicum baccatum]|uniref:Uncharacterized protein n=1 Tax=Capsicum baccatum TaxID=33114 RepID=A0A2G2WKM4_CAPBA|nr:hypothetical protein CQW23_14877 [Capsicum baccatum]